MPEQRSLDSVVITVDGAPLAAALYPRITRVLVEESVHLPDAFTVRFDDAHFELFDEDRFRPGTHIEIAFRADGDPVMVTAGEVTSVSVTPGVSGRHELVLGGLDLTHRLTRGPKTRSFTRMSDADIASRIAGEYGLDTDIDATDETREYVLQAGETDYGFLRRLADRIGFDLWVGDRTLHFKRRPSARSTAPSLRWGDNLLDFTVRCASAEHCDEVVVTAWDPVDKRTITGRATDPDHGTDAPVAADMADAARRAFGRVSRRAGHVPVASQAEADAFARSLLWRASGAEVVLRGEAVGNPLIAAGAQVKLERVGNRLSGTYRVTGVEHDYGSGRPYTTRFTCGAKDAGELADLLGGNSGSGGDGAGAVGGRHDGKGLTVGVVTNNDDPEHLGRVKVKFPTLSGEDESNWARVAAPGAGGQRGMQWLPEVDDEVLIGFESGDRNRPFVLGGLWNRGDVPPVPAPTRDGKVTERLLVSRKDHRLVFTDDPAGSVRLSLGDGDCALTLEKSESSLEAEQTLTISARRIEIKAGEKLVLGAPEVEVSARSELKATGNPIRLN
ncbi:VgrG-related protein [Streptomyces sp. NRRL S-118]|uniref:VgrG-related protein n=1 Tax=Streptomyces sp. NRRL S-118 TaxID=1463881 RepID=UPI0004C5635A|nr:VgrG-related protein [Streptomyces sp. NRRL S-118]